MVSFVWCYCGVYAVLAGETQNSERKLTSLPPVFRFVFPIDDQVALTSASRQPPVPVQQSSSIHPSHRPSHLFIPNYILCHYFGYVLTIHVTTLVMSFLCFCCFIFGCTKRGQGLIRTWPILMVRCICFRLRLAHQSHHLGNQRRRADALHVLVLLLVALLRHRLTPIMSSKNCETPIPLSRHNNGYFSFRFSDQCKNACCTRIEALLPRTIKIVDRTLYKQIHSLRRMSSAAMRSFLQIANHAARHSHNSERWHKLASAFQLPLSSHGQFTIMMCSRCV